MRVGTGVTVELGGGTGVITGLGVPVAVGTGEGSVSPQATETIAIRASRLIPILNKEWRERVGGGFKEWG